MKLHFLSKFEKIPPNTKIYFCLLQETPYFFIIPYFSLTGAIYCFYVGDIKILYQPAAPTSRLLVLINRLQGTKN